MEMVAAVVARHGGGDVACATEPEEVRRLWQVRLCDGMWVGVGPGPGRGGV